MERTGTEKSSGEIRTPEMELFAEEYLIIGEAQDLLSRPGASPDELRAGFQFLLKKYKRLLNQTVKITKVGDSAQGKLMRIQQELDGRNRDLEDANLKLKDLDQIKARFTAMLVHDLKSPLSVVRGTLEMFTFDESVMNSYLGDLVKTSEQSVEKILGLINEVLEVFRSENQDIVLDRVRLDPIPLLAECVLEARLTAKTVEIDVESVIPDRLPMISADPGKLGRVFANLLSNAVKFTSPGGKITLEATAAPGQGVEVGSTLLVVKITDTGEGIPAEEIPFLFDAYRQASSKKARLGVGLGLSIVQSIVAAHGGTISVRSKVGVGSCFTVVLPALGEPAESN